MDLLQSAVVGGMLAGSVYALLGLGLLLAALATRAVNLAGGEFYILAGFVLYSAGPVLGVPLAIAFGIGAGLLLERVALRPASDAPRSTAVLATVAAAWIARGLFRIAWGWDPVAPPAVTAALSPGGRAAVVIIGALAAAVLLWWWLGVSDPGRALRALYDHPEGAVAAGVDRTAGARMAMGLAGGLVAVGAVLASPLTFVVADGGVPLLMRGIVVALMGGMTRPLLVLAAGWGVGLVESLTAAVGSSMFRDVITYCLLLPVLAVLGRGDGS